MRLAPLPVLAAAAFFLGAGASSAQSLLVLSKGDLTLAIVDPSTRKVVARMPSGPNPHEVIASSDGSTAFISNYGANNTLTVADLRDHKTLGTIDLGVLRSPHGLDSKGGKIWFTAEAAKVIGSYDPASKKIDWILGTGQNRTHMIFVSDDLRRIVTSNVASATMTIIDRTEGRGRGPGEGGPDWNETVVPVGRGGEGFDVSPDGKEIWVANAQDGTVSVIDAAAKKVTATLAADVRGANRLKFTPDGKLVFISTLGGPEVVVLDAATHAAVKRIKTGRGAAGIQMQPDGSKAYVSCTPDDYVAIIDLKSLDVAGRIDAGKQPDGLAWVARR